MTIEEFIQRRIQELNTFKENMKSLKLNNLSEREWMETYLNWNEYTTEMKDQLWH